MIRYKRIALLGFRYSLVFGILFLNAACEKQPDTQLALTSFKLACMDKWTEVEYIAKVIEGEVEKGGRRDPDVNVLNASKRIAVWKKLAVPKLSVDGLNLYLDSLSYWEKNRMDSAFFDFRNYEKNISQGEIRNVPSAIKKIRRLETTSDSLQYFQTLFLALYNEEAIQTFLVAKVGSENWSFDKFRTDKLNYSAGDTVKMIIMVEKYYPERKMTYFLKGMKLVLNNKPTTVPISTENINGIFYLNFRVPETGIYNLKGAVYTYYPESKNSKLNMLIDQEIRVR